MVEELCLRLLLEWLQDSYGVAFAAEGSPQAGWAEARSGPHSMRLHIGALWEEDEPWSRSRRALEEETGRGLDGAWILWVPPGAALPAQGPAAADFVRRVRDVASALAPGRRSYVPLPALLYLVKTDEAGGYVSAEGGLSPYWAHLSERVQGTYFLDSRSLHRLPEGDKARDELLRTIVELAAELPLNRLTEIPCTDAWTLQRLRTGPGRAAGPGGLGTNGLAIVAASPALAGEGAVVRRLLHRLVARANEAFAQRQTDLQVAVAIGAYQYVGQENVTAFLRGFDPVRYAHLDALFLAADGQIKPILPLRQAPWGGP